MSNAHDPLRNPKDPLHREGPAGEHELFRRLSKVATEGGFPLDMVIGATMNLLVNAVRQANATWPNAEARYDFWTQRFKQILKNHYDGGGNRRNVFPFDQTINMAHFVDQDGFRRKN